MPSPFVLLVNLHTLLLMRKGHCIINQVVHVEYVNGHFILLLFDLYLLCCYWLLPSSNVFRHFIRSVFFIEEVCLGHLLHDVSTAEIVYETSDFLHVCQT